MQELTLKWSCERKDKKGGGVNRQRQKWVTECGVFFAKNMA